MPIAATPEKKGWRIFWPIRRKQIFGLLQSRMSGDFVPIRQVALNVLDKIEQATRSKSTVTGVPTGFIDLDYRTSGLQPSDLILIAARPSMGKTAFVLNIADYIAVRRQKTCLIFSLEMSKEQLVNRMLAMESNVDSQKLRTGTLTDADWDAVVEGIATIGNSKLVIDDTPGISIMELRSKCRKIKLEHGLDIVMIDYLQLMTRKRKDQRQQAAGDLGDFPFLKGSGKRVERAGDCAVAAFPCLRDANRTTVRCSQTFVSPGPSSRMRTWLCSYTGTIITTKIRTRPMWRRSSSQSRGTAPSGP